MLLSILVFVLALMAIIRSRQVIKAERYGGIFLPECPQKSKNVPIIAWVVQACLTVILDIALIALYFKLASTGNEYERVAWVIFGLVLFIAPVFISGALMINTASLTSVIFIHWICNKHYRIPKLHYIMCYICLVITSMNTFTVISTLVTKFLLNV